MAATNLTLHALIKEATLHNNSEFTFFGASSMLSKTVTTTKIESPTNFVLFPFAKNPRTHPLQHAVKTKWRHLAVRLRSYWTDLLDIQTSVAKTRDRKQNLVTRVF